MNTRLAIATAVGLTGSILLDILGSTFRNTLLQYLVLPGHVAIIAIFGAHGHDDIPFWLFMTVGSLTNTAVYSLIAFVVLTCVPSSNRLRDSKDR
ncbi:hypothetical protein JJB98_05130 [Bradyrhizobium diazoefficiens]|nr:hypothetical protein [Bradyrhizobium diazoefficiens]QQO19333.1 hypothetical protein JJB98_05130 [Bradyrhizobium diazoefficiens]